MIVASFAAGATTRKTKSTTERSGDSDRNAVGFDHEGQGDREARTHCFVDSRLKTEVRDDGERLAAAQIIQWKVCIIRPGGLADRSEQLNLALLFAGAKAMMAMRYDRESARMHARWLQGLEAASRQASTQLRSRIDLG